MRLVAFTDDVASGTVIAYPLFGNQVYACVIVGRQLVKAEREAPLYALTQFSPKTGAAEGVTPTWISIQVEPAAQPRQLILLGKSRLLPGAEDDPQMERIGARSNRQVSAAYRRDLGIPTLISNGTDQQRGLGWVHLDGK